jgi:hypothetical protein
VANSGGNVVVPNSSTNNSNDPSATNSSSGSASITTGSVSAQGSSSTSQNSHTEVVLLTGQPLHITFTGTGTLDAYLLAPGQAEHAPTDTPVVHCALACQATYNFTDRNAGFRLEIVSSTSGEVTLG